MHVGVNVQQGFEYHNFARLLKVCSG